MVFFKNSLARKVDIVNNDNNNEVLIKCESLVLLELGALYRQKRGQNSTTAITS